MIYLDHAATTPLRPQAAEAMEPFLRDRFGNTSGSHDVSRRAKNALAEAREQAAEVLGASPIELIFTGGHEADNLASRAPLFQTGEGSRGANEHEAVLETGHFSREWEQFDIIGVDHHGVWTSINWRCRRPPTAVVSVMVINMRPAPTPIQRVVEASALEPSNPVHTDAFRLSYISRTDG